MSDPDTHDYKMGTTVAFRDSQATVSDSSEGVSEGVVNGSPLRDDNGAITHIRVFADRDNGREATTIIVGVGNVLGKVEQ